MSGRFRFLGVVGLLFAAKLLAEVSPAPGLPSVMRAFSVDDVLQLQGLGHGRDGPAVYSSDGTCLALTLLRAKTSRRAFDSLGPLESSATLLLNDGADVWVRMSNSSRPINITEGGVDGSDSFEPRWSPDSQRLAFLSTRGGHIRLWIWERDSQKLTPVTPPNMDAGLLPIVSSGPPFLWIDEHRVLCPISDYTTGLFSLPVASPGNPNVGVLSSGTPAQAGLQRGSTLEIIDVRSGASTTLSTGRTQSWCVSDDRKLVAFFRQIGFRDPRQGSPMPASNGVYAVEIVRTDGISLKLEHELPRDVATTSVLRWAPARNELAIFALPGSPTGIPEVWRVAPFGNYARSINLDALQPMLPKDRWNRPRVEWASGSLLFSTSSFADQDSSTAKQTQWWCSDEGGRVVKFEVEDGPLPAELLPITGSHDLVGMRDGALFRVDQTLHRVVRLTPAQLRIRRIVSPREEPGGARRLMVEALSDNLAPQYLLVDPMTGVTTPVPSTTGKGVFDAYSGVSEYAVFHSADRNGLYVWEVNIRSQESHEIFTANEFLRGIEEAEIRPLQYSGINGAALQGWLILPHNYIVGKKYPLITWVYPGLVYGPTAPRITSISDRQFLNLQIPAALGYAVLLPSMPVAPPRSEGADPILSLADGVLPAVQKAIDLGVVDPASVFLLGHSFGGYATYGLITQTSRFRAAAALSGISDPISFYGIFHARYRYTALAQRTLDQSPMAFVEAGQFGLGGKPPWENLARYLRNSPLALVDRVSTPLLIIHGGRDVGLESAEQFFSALCRQGKRAEFARYWDEGHIFQNPDNIRDVWTRILNFFDECGNLARDEQGNWLFQGAVVQPRNRTTTPSENR